LVFAILFLPLGVMGLIESRSRRKRLRSRPEPAGQDHLLRETAPIGPASASAKGELLRCEDIRLAFRGVKALDGVTIDVREGEILGIVGPNGSGKSTLVNVISGFYRPDSGRIMMDNRDLASLAAHHIARAGVARTYQIPRPFAHLSVQENVALPAMFGHASLAKTSAAHEAYAQISFVGLQGRELALPTEINLHQRKFLEMARALAARPKLILLDEVLAGLTAPEIEGAISLIRQIRANGTTIVFIEHNMQAVLALADRLVVLNYGRVIATGRPRDVVRQPEVMTAYLGMSHA
jgi:branched-chain amino acid transport system permease protein